MFGDIVCNIVLRYTLFTWVFNLLKLGNETWHWIPVSLLQLQDTYSRKSWTTRISEFNYIQRHPYDFNKSFDASVSDSSEKLRGNFNDQRTVRHYIPFACSVHRCPTLKWLSLLLRVQKVWVYKLAMVILRVLSHSSRFVQSNAGIVFSFIHLLYSIYPSLDTDTTRCGTCQ